MSGDIVSKLRQSYCLSGTERTHPIRQAVEEIERLRESVERFMRLAAEARADADALRRQHDGPGGVVTAPSAKPVALSRPASVSVGHVNGEPVEVNFVIDADAVTRACDAYEKSSGGAVSPSRKGMRAALRAALGDEHA